MPRRALEDVRPEPRERARVQLEHGPVPEHALERLAAQHEPRLARRAPSPRGRTRPAAGHAQVRAQDDAALEAKQQVLADRLDRFEHAPVDALGDPPACARGCGDSTSMRWPTSACSRRAARWRCRPRARRHGNLAVVAFPRLAYPIVQAPLSGGRRRPSSPPPSRRGRPRFLAAGYKTAAELRRDRRARELTAASFGANLFVLEERPVDSEALAAYRRRARAGEAARYGVELGAARTSTTTSSPRSAAVLAEARVAVVSTAFGCPSSDARRPSARRRDRRSG